MENIDLSDGADDDIELVDDRRYNQPQDITGDSDGDYDEEDDVNYIGD